MPIGIEHQLGRINIGKIFKDLKDKTQIIPKVEIGTFRYQFSSATRSSIPQKAGRADCQMSKA
ncbi:MAG: hypothetical protein KJP06_05300 [Deltaproteobacteria bacterium]|nr:hypothetical protein [Deltaproteobacteria bacterium]